MGLAAAGAIPVAPPTTSPDAAPVAAPDAGAASSAPEAAGQPNAPQPNASAPQPDVSANTGATAPPADSSPPADIRNSLPPAEPGVMAQITMIRRDPSNMPPQEQLDSTTPRASFTEPPTSTSSTEPSASTQPLGNDAVRDDGRKDIPERHMPKPLPSVGNIDFPRPAEPSWATDATGNASSPTNSSTEPSTSTQPPAQGPMMVDSDTNTVDTGSYTIHASKDDGGTLTVTDNATGQNVKVWGDLHLETSDGDKTGFARQPATLKLPDGTKVTVTPTEGEGATYIDKVTITRNNDAAQISGIHDGDLHTKARPKEGNALDNATFDGTTLKAKDGNINDLVLADGTEIKDNNVQNIDYRDFIPTPMPERSLPATDDAGNALSPGFDRANNRFVLKNGSYIDCETNRMYYQNGIFTEPLSSSHFNAIVQGGFWVNDGSGEVANVGLDEVNKRYVYSNGDYYDLTTRMVHDTSNRVIGPIPEGRIDKIIAANRDPFEAFRQSLYPDDYSQNNAWELYQKHLNTPPPRPSGPGEPVFGGSWPTDILGPITYK
jgi:hypothetical protein